MHDKEIVTVTDILEAVLCKVKLAAKQAGVLVVISGIDASGKTALASYVCENLRRSSLEVFLISLDDWHRPMEVRFNSEKWAENYYENAYHFDELFDSLILPLKRDRSIHLTLELMDAVTNVPRPRTFNASNVDVILLEGIFLLQPKYRDYYDLAYWIDCPARVALRRAVQRNQESLSEPEIVALYNRVFFPAQRVHLTRDDPVSLADGVFVSEVNNPFSSKRMGEDSVTT